jgi:hypothetical protein
VPIEQIILYLKFQGCIYTLYLFQGESGSPQYNSELVVLILSTLDTATTASSCIRLVTLRLATMLLYRLLGTSTTTTSPQLEGAAIASPLLQDHHVALIESIYESAILRLRLYYKVS